MDGASNSFPGPAYQRMARSGREGFPCPGAGRAAASGPGSALRIAAGLAAAAGAGQAAGVPPAAVGISFAASLVLIAAAGIRVTSGITSASAAVRAVRNPDSPASRAGVAFGLLSALLALQCIAAVAFRPSGVLAAALGAETALVSLAAVFAATSVLPAGSKDVPGLLRSMAGKSAEAFTAGSLALGAAWAACGAQGNPDAMVFVLALGTLSAAARVAACAGPGTRRPGRAPRHESGAVSAASAAALVGSAPSMLLVLLLFGPGAGLLFVPAAAASAAASAYVSSAESRAGNRFFRL